LITPRAHAHSYLRIAAVALCAAAGCREARERPPAPAMHPAEALFWDVFGHQQHARIPELLATLERASQADPSQARLALLSGATHLWAVAEPALARPADAASEVQAGLAAFARYHAMVPSDARLAGWEGPMLAGSAFALAGRAAALPNGAAKQALAQQGALLLDRALEVLDAGVQAEPRFNLFGRFIVTALLPATSERFQQAVRDVAALHDVRLGAALDPRRPDVSPLLEKASPCDPAHPPAWPFAATSDETTFKRDPRCWNSWKTPFAYEGFWLYSGDVVLKSGDVEAARTSYRNAQKLASYRRWPYAVYAEERLARADELAARLRDGDPTNDPELVIRAPANCLVCHAVAGSRPILDGSR
jgi:hypothetical protein